MKYFLLIGGLCGFTLVFVTSLLAGHELIVTLRDAAFGCLAGGALFRVLHSVLLSSIRSMLIEEAARNQTSTSTEKPTPPRK